MASVDISALYQHIGDAQAWSWHTRVKKGFFKTETTYPIISDITNALTYFDMQDPAAAQRFREYLTAHLLSAPTDGGHLMLAALLGGMKEEELNARVAWLRRQGIKQEKMRHASIYYLLLWNWQDAQRLLPYVERESMVQALNSSGEYLRNAQDLAVLAHHVEEVSRQYPGKSQRRTLEAYRCALLGCALPACLVWIGKEGLANVLCGLRDLLAAEDLTFKAAFLRGMQDIPVSSADDLVEYLEIAKAYYRTLGSSMYANRIIEKNLLHLPAFAGHLGYRAPDGTRMSFMQYRHSNPQNKGVVIPLGGRLTGNIIRVMKRAAFVHWKRAYEAGVPTEEILKDARGRYRVQERDGGWVAVITQYAGQQFGEYLKTHPSQYLELHRQKLMIMQRLRWLHIQHRDLHDGNFVVSEVDGKPLVRVIDFEFATYGEFLPRMVFLDAWKSIYQMFKPKRPTNQMAEI